MAILNCVMRLFLAAMYWKPQTRPQSRVRILYKTVKRKLILSVIIPPFVMFLIANAQEINTRCFIIFFNCLPNVTLKKRKVL